MNDQPLQHRILDEPYRFDFFQAVRLINKLYPNRKPVGGNALPHEEPVRFRTKLSLDFPASQIDTINTSVDEKTGNDRYDMLINFMGMLGTSGMLPIHYTELAIDRIRHRDTAMWEFLDMFTHRSVSMFYRAWAKYRFPVGYEQGNDDFTSYLFDFAGIGTRGLRGRMDVDDEALLPYVGLISQRPHSATALANTISDYFSIPASIKQFFGQWLELDPIDHTFLGKANNRLGSRAIAGTKVWDQQSKFRVKLGPLNFKQFEAFLPVGSAYKPLKSIVQFITGQEIDFDVQLELRKEQVPATILTTRAVRKPLLGWTSFVKAKPKSVIDDQQLVLQYAE